MCISSTTTPSLTSAMEGSTSYEAPTLSSTAIDETTDATTAALDEDGMVVTQRHMQSRAFPSPQKCSPGLVLSYSGSDDDSDEECGIVGALSTDSEVTALWAPVTSSGTTLVNSPKQNFVIFLQESSLSKVSVFREFFHKNGRSLQFAFAAVGIICSYLVQGYYQEDLFSYKSPVDGSKFRYAWLLQSLECTCNFTFAFLVRLGIGGGGQKLPLKSLCLVGTSQLFSKTFTSLSLAAGLSFPICTLSKSAKMVPVMIGQLAVGSSSFSWKDYTIAAAIVCGTVILSLGNSQGKSQQGHGTSASDTTLLGVACILFSLSMDGVTAGLQSGMKMKMKNCGQGLKTIDMLMWVNFSMAICASIISVITGDWYRGLDYISKNPFILRIVIITCVGSIVGQTFIFFMITNFDPLACTTVTTSRKIMSVLWSIVAKGHSVSNVSAFGIAIAIAGLVFETKKNISSVKSNK